MPWLLRAVIAIIANAVALLVAALLLNGFSIEVIPFITVAIIFTLATVLIKPLMYKLAGRYAPGATFVAGLATVFVGLLVADVVTGSSLQISGVWTWVWATVIVWVGTLIYDVVDDRAIAALRRGLSGEPGGKTA